MEIKISFHYGGTFFRRNNRILYRKGNTCLSPGYDADLLSYFEVLDIFKEQSGLSNAKVKEMWYLPAGLTINEGLKQVKVDADIMSMVESVGADKVAHVYVVVEGECSPGEVHVEKVKVVNMPTPVRRSPRNLDTSKSDCLAIVVYEGGNRSADQPSHTGEASHIPTQGSGNMDRMRQGNEQSAAADADEEGLGSDEVSSGDPTASDASVDCDYKETDDEDEDVFFEDERDEVAENLGADICREFDFEKETNADIDPGSDVEEESDGLKTPECSDDEGEPSQRKFIVFNHFEGFVGPIHLEEGMLFASKEIFKKAITQYSVERGGDFYYLHNDKRKVNVLCKNKCDCPWKHCRRACGAKGRGTLKCRFRAAARLYSDDGTFQLKSLTGDHTCGKQFFIGKIKSKYLAEKYIKHYKDDPEMKLRVFMSTVRRDLGVKITYAQACRTRKITHLMIQGDAKEQYALVCDYAETLIKHRVADAAYVHCHGSIERPIFQRLFVCLRACSRGFFLGCRRIIGVDGCHLKGAYSGQILSAVGKDGNENIYPIAYVVVESECKEIWGWFLENLMQELGDFEICIMSDRQKPNVEPHVTIPPVDLDEIPQGIETEGNTYPESFEINYDTVMNSETQQGDEEEVQPSRPKKQKKRKSKRGYIWDKPDRYRWEDAPVTGSIPTSPVQWTWGRKGEETATNVVIPPVFAPTKDTEKDKRTETRKGKEKVADLPIPPQAQKGKEKAVGVAIPSEAPKGKEKLKIRGSPEYKRSSRLRSLPTTTLTRKPLWKL